MTTRSDHGAQRDRRGGGRPAGAEGRDVRRRLLLSARDLFSKQGFDGTSIRQIATEARATPAMIHYYFGDKHGLYRALIDEIIRPVVRGLEARAGDAGTALTVEEFMNAYTGMFGRHPWLPVLVFREMHEGGEAFRRHFAQQFGSRLRALLGEAFEQARARGELRPSVDIDLAIVSVISLCIFPFLARPMLERVMGETIDSKFVERWLAHADRLLQDGLGP